MRKLRLRHIAALAASTLFAVLGIVAPGNGQIHIPATSSVPFDLYLETSGNPEPGDYVLVRVPDTAARFARERGYWSGTSAWIKQIAAKTGDQVCVEHGHVFINGRNAAAILNNDTQGRKLMHTTICRTLTETEFYILGRSDHSYDSRYFGPVPASSIVSKLRPVFSFFD